MKVIFVAFVIGVVAADVSHLSAPSRSYLPPSAGGIQGFSQFGGGSGQQYGGGSGQQYGGGSGQHFGGGAGQQFGGRQGQQQLPSNQYLAPRGGGFDANSQSGFGAGQIRTPSNQYLGPNQGPSSYGSSSLSSPSFGSQSYQRGGSAYQPSGQIQSSRFGQSNDLIPGHTLSEDGYRYRSPSY